MKLSPAVNRFLDRVNIRGKHITYVLGYPLNENEISVSVEEAAMTITGAHRQLTDLKTWEQFAKRYADVRKLAVNVEFFSIGEGSQGGPE